VRVLQPAFHDSRDFRPGVLVGQTSVCPLSNFPQHKKRTASRLSDHPFLSRNTLFPILSTHSARSASLVLQGKFQTAVSKQAEKTA
jgi:hypothetical protein